MTPSQKLSNHRIYDYIVIGGGLSGLSIANALQKISDNVLVVEALDHVGGHNRGVTTPAGTLTNGLRFLPDTELSRKAVLFLQGLLEKNLNPVSTESPPLTYESGALRPFLGFGDLSPEFYDELSYFFHPRQLALNLKFHEWTSELASHYSGEVLSRAVVTKLIGTEGQISSILVNGQRHISGHNFIYCGPIKDLELLLPADALSARAKTRFSKSKFCTAVGLDLVHSSHISDSSAIHVLNGTTQDEVGPCVGKFSPTQDPTTAVQCSQWLSFVDDDDAEDTESIGAALKKMKRQIKRAYPTALDTVSFERIFVAPSLSGHGDLKLTSSQNLPTYPNLWIGSAAMNPNKNLLGSLLQAELIASCLGCHPMGLQVEVAVEESLISETLAEL